MTYKKQSEIRYQAILKLEAKIQQLKKENAELKARLNAINLPTLELEKATTY